MQFGLHVPLMGAYAEPRVAVELAKEAEDAGWDGFFAWDHVAPTWHELAGDAWITLAGIATATTRMRIGTAITPLPRRRPWKVAREAVALDHLSGGRMTLGTGLGGLKTEFDDLGEETDLAVRAAMLDEGLEIVTGLWRGEPFTYHGRYYTLQNQRFLPRPLQQDRIPIWLAATWPNKAPFRRAARWDGVFPSAQGLDFGTMAPIETMAEIISYVRAHRQVSKPFDFLHGGITSGNDPAKDADIAAAYAEIGVTWWIESVNPDRWGGWHPWPADQIRARIRLGPPRR